MSDGQSAGEAIERAEERERDRALAERLKQEVLRVNGMSPEMDAHEEAAEAALMRAGHQIAQLQARVAALQAAQETGLRQLSQYSDEVAALRGQVERYREALVDITRAEPGKGNDDLNAVGTCAQCCQMLSVAEDALSTTTPEQSNTKRLQDYYHRSRGYWHDVPTPERQAVAVPVEVARAAILLVEEIALAPWLKLNPRAAWIDLLAALRGEKGEADEG